MKRLVNVGKKFVRMIVQAKDTDKSDAFKGCDLILKDELVKIISNYDELF